VPVDGTSRLALMSQVESMYEASAKASGG